MKKVILVVVLLPYMATAQVADNFESGVSVNWVQSIEGRWTADTTGAISGKASLRHSYDNPDAGTDRIGISLANIHPVEGVTKWSFLIKHGYDPSSSNNWSVFLFSDRSPGTISPDENTNGFAIGVNLTGYDDTIRLWKIKEGLMTVVVNCRINWQTLIGISDPVKISVERNQEGRWSVSVYTINGILITETMGNETELFDSSWFGIFYRYTSSRDRLLWIDDINIDGVFYTDTTPPLVTRCEVRGKKSIEIALSEEPVAQFGVPENFCLNPGENIPVSVLKINDLVFLIEFADEFINKSSNRLNIKYICDNEGNCRQDTELEFTPVWAERGDIIISEIMADPLPWVSLPGREYLEITNRTSFSFDLEEWGLTIGDRTVLLPQGSIGPSEVQILCSVQDTSLFREFGMVTGIKQFPLLADKGSLVYISDTSGTLIHGVEYSDEWYGNELKSQGGWSLEIKDASYPFNYDSNWAASVSRMGGTPGSINSIAGVNRDITFSGITNVFPVDTRNIKINFSEPVSDFSGINIGFIKEGPTIDDVIKTDPLFREFILRISDPVIAGKNYQIELPEEITDFAGNKMANSTYIFGLAEPPSMGDIMFNELLFNPLPGDPDYLELYNCSGKIINASRLHLVYVNDETSDTSALDPVSLKDRCIMPGSYYSVTTGRKRIIDRYFSAEPESLFEIPSVPSMPDDEGILILFNNELDIIDKVSYSEEMHYSLLSGFEGIALEKTGPCNLSQHEINWHSAAESSGWGTPGAPNSVFAETSSLQSDVIGLSSTKISPDNDGNEDFLSVSLNLKGTGNIVSITVFDENGNFVKKIAANVLTGPEASFIWDGTVDDRSPAESGIYIILITLFDDTGKTNRWKKVCTVLRE